MKTYLFKKAYNILNILFYLYIYVYNFSVFYVKCIGVFLIVKALYKCIILLLLQVFKPLALSQIYLNVEECSDRNSK